MVGVLTLLSATAFLASQAFAAAPSFTQLTIDPNTFPAACVTICTPITDALNTCVGLDCLCTNANAQSLLTCADCTVGTDPTTAVTTQGQSLVDQFVDECAVIGVHFAPMTVQATPPTGSAAVNTATATAPSFVTFNSLSVSATGPAASPSSGGGSGGSSGNPFARNAAGRLGASFGAIAGTVMVGVLALLM